MFYDCSRKSVNWYLGYSASCYKYSLDLGTICTLSSSIVATRFYRYCFHCLKLHSRTNARRGPPLMFRAAKITLRIGFTARHFDQFRGCSTGRTFHRPGRARALWARYKALFQRNCQVESSGAELNSCHGGARSLVYFLWLICVRVACRKFAYSNSRGVVTSFVLFSSAHRIGHLSGARIYSLA